MDSGFLQPLALFLVSWYPPPRPGKGGGRHEEQTGIPVFPAAPFHVFQEALMPFSRREKGTFFTLWKGMGK
jgi:hypothetical protein